MGCDDDSDVALPLISVLKFGNVSVIFFPIDYLI